MQAIRLFLWNIFPHCRRGPIRNLANRETDSQAERSRERSGSFPHEGRHRTNPGSSIFEMMSNNTAWWERTHHNRKNNGSIHVKGRQFLRRKGLGRLGEFGGMGGKQRGMGVATLNERDGRAGPTHAVAPIAMREPKQ